MQARDCPSARVAFEQIAAEHKPRLVVIDVIAFAEDMEHVHALDPWYPRSPVLRALTAAEGMAAWLWPVPWRPRVTGATGR